MNKTINRAAAAVRSRMENRDEQGFTILELIIVLTILGVLMAIAIPFYGDIRHKSRTSAVAAVADNAYSSAIVAIEDGIPDSVAVTAVTAVDGDSPDVIVTMDNFGGYENLERRFVCIEATWVNPDDHVASVTVGDGCGFRSN